MKGDRMGVYTCKVEGEYIIKEAGGKSIRPYELEFKVPDLGPDKTDIHYLSVIKNKLLTPALKKKYPGAITYRTHEMADRISDEPNKNQTGDKPKTVGQMNKTELTEYANANCPEINLEVYNTVDKMRTAIRDYEEGKEAFLKDQAELISEKELENTLKELNE